MVGWHHRLKGHEFELPPGVGDGQGGLACCSPWGRKDSDMTERLNETELLVSLPVAKTEERESLLTQPATFPAPHLGRGW